jgi:hypothetical protein
MILRFAAVAAFVAISASPVLADTTTYTINVPFSAKKLPLKAPSGSPISYKITCFIEAPNTKSPFIGAGIAPVPLDPFGNFLGSVIAVPVTKATGGIAGTSYACNFNGFDQNATNVPGMFTGTSSVTGNANFP